MNGKNRDLMNEFLFETAFQLQEWLRNCRQKNKKQKTKIVDARDAKGDVNTSDLYHINDAFNVR